MLFLTKKKKEERPLPTDEVVKMSQSGMSDKDIIRHLKSEGYTYDEIEKAMLMAMKSTVKSPKPKQSEQSASEQLNVPQSAQFNPSFGGAQSQMPSLPQGESFENLPSQPSVQEPPQDFSQSVEDTVDINNIVEDIIQSMVNEKWEKIDARMKEVEREMEDAKKLLSNIKTEKKQEVSKEEIDEKFGELDTKVEDLEVRVGALEKSFKQLLPTLVDNIQNLSNIVETLKKRHEDLEKKTLHHIYGDDVPWSDSIKKAQDKS